MTFRRILTLLAALALAACDSLPASGPTRNEIQTAVNPDLPGEIEAGFTIVEMSDEVSAKLEAWPKLVPTCQTPCSEGMVVHTDSPKASYRSIAVLGP